MCVSPSFVFLFWVVLRIFVCFCFAIRPSFTCSFRRYVIMGTKPTRMTSPCTWDNFVSIFLLPPVRSDIDIWLFRWTIDLLCLLLCNVKNNQPVSTRQWTATFRYTSTTSSLNSCVVVVVVVVVRPLHARAWSCFCLASVVSMGYYSLPAVELNRLPELLRARRERESTPSSPPLSCLQPKKDTILCYLSS